MIKKPIHPPTEAELASVLSKLTPQGAPYCVYDVGQSQFSIARHYGGMKLNGFNFTYFAESDILWRDDVLNAVSKLRKEEANANQSSAGIEQVKLL